MLTGAYVTGGVFATGALAFVVAAAALPSQAVFWSGGGIGGAAFLKAQQFAVETPGYFTIEGTALGRYLSALNQALPDVINEWATASSLFASRASGVVHIFTENPLPPVFYGSTAQNIFLDIEYWALEANPNITAYVFHNVITGEVVTITKAIADML